MTMLLTNTVLVVTDMESILDLSLRMTPFLA